MKKAYFLFYDYGVFGVYLYVREIVEKYNCIIVDVNELIRSEFREVTILSKKIREDLDKLEELGANCFYELLDKKIKSANGSNLIFRYCPSDSNKWILLKKILDSENYEIQRIWYLNGIDFTTNFEGYLRKKYPNRIKRIDEQMEKQLKLRERSVSRVNEILNEMDCEDRLDTIYMETFGGKNNGSPEVNMKRFKNNI